MNCSGHSFATVSMIMRLSPGPQRAAKSADSNDAIITPMTIERWSVRFMLSIAAHTVSACFPRSLTLGALGDLI